MKVLALVPARSGSKRLLHKNKKLLAGKPLIQWTFDFASHLPDFCDVLLTSDDPEIIEFSKNLNISAPWVRPAELALDNSSSVDVALHAINWYEENHGSVDCLLLLQPTSPIRRISDFQRGIRLFLDFGAASVVSVAKSETHPMWAYKMDGAYLKPYLTNSGKSFQSQDLPDSYTPNGAFFFISPSELRNEKAFITDKTVPLIIEGPVFNLDIDTKEDFDMAQFLIKRSEIQKSEEWIQ